MKHYLPIFIIFHLVITSRSDSKIVEQAVSKCCSDEKRHCCRQALDSKLPILCNFSKKVAIMTTACLEQHLWGSIEYLTASCCTVLPPANDCRSECQLAFGSPSIAPDSKLDFLSSCVVALLSPTEKNCFTICAQRLGGRWADLDAIRECRQIYAHNPVFIGQNLDRIRRRG